MENGKWIGDGKEVMNGARGVEIPGLVVMVMKYGL